jgi:hypothetical protein
MALKAFIQQCLDQNYESMIRSVDGLTQKEFAWRPGPQSMSIGFLVWHYARTLDRWVHTRALEALQLWEQGWASQFERLPSDSDVTGYGFTAEQLEGFETPPASVLLAYAGMARNKAMELLEGLDDYSLEEVTIPNPRGGRISLATMFQQLIWEFNQHGGQIAYIRGMQRGIEDPAYSGGVLEAAAEDAE